MHSYKKLIYRLDRETGWYGLQNAPVTASTLPNELKVEESRLKKINAGIIIHGRERLPKEVDPKTPWRWFTGLRPTEFPNDYNGHFRTPTRAKGKFRNHLTIFRFSPNSELLTIFFFEGLERHFGPLHTLLQTL